jgi:hypothetical protein
MSRHVLPVFAMLIGASPLLAGPQGVLDIAKVPAEGKTVVWSPLFQASWDRLNATHGGNSFFDSVRTLYYTEGGDSFILSIVTDRKDEALVIYRPTETVSIGKAIDQVKNVMKDPMQGPSGSLTDGTLHAHDTVKIPYLKLHVNTFFTNQLAAERYYAGDPLPCTIAMARQTVRVELSERGAQVRVQEDLSDDPFGEPSKPPKVTYVARNFVCDTPFFVFAWKSKADFPYLAGWIGSSDPLQPFDRKAAGRPSE